MARLLAPLLACTVGALLLVGHLGEPVPREGPENGPQNGDDWFALQRSYPTGRRPPTDALDRAMAARRAGPGRRPSLSLPGSQWVSIGPSPIYTGSTLWAGRIRSEERRVGKEWRAWVAPG